MVEVFEYRVSNMMKLAQIIVLATTTTVLFVFAVDYSVAKEDRFTLVRGRHVGVCEAYRKRLNATNFEQAPVCDRPEDISVPGFANLNRVPLTSDEVFKLWPSVGAMEKPASDTSDWTLDAAKQELGRTILAWKYDPNADVQNNGSSQTVVMWRGSRLHLGIENSDFACGLSDSRTPQLAFIVSASQSEVDEAATRRVFWRAKPAILSYTVDGKLHHQSIDLPVGWNMSIFKFEGLYYFDTFYNDDGWGDYQNKRRKDKALARTLAVFLHRNGETREMCELRLN